jgi:hypothetical protein
VARSCNPSYSESGGQEGGGQEGGGLRPVHETVISTNKKLGMVARAMVPTMREFGRVNRIVVMPRYKHETLYQK